MGKKMESGVTLIDRPISEVYHFLNDFNNFSHLMPEQVINWQATSDSCSFEIKGLATLGMRIIEREPNSKIVMKSEGKLPFNFFLNANLSTVDENSCNVQLIIDADMNPFISMMAEKPLANFVNVLALKLKEVMEKNSA
jgi:carbon monoxide dehydrogenase subunit G